jgi:hypothetical protein
MQNGQMKEQLGKIGEKVVFEYLQEKKAKQNIQIIIPDFLLVIGQNLIVIEVKVKERFKPPPFEGHGLPISQVKKYMFLYKKWGIKTFLIVIEPNTNMVWGQYLDVLEKGKHYITHLKKIVVYSLKSFRRIYGVEQILKRKKYKGKMIELFVLSEVERKIKEGDIDFIKKLLGTEKG